MKCVHFYKALIFNGIIQDTDLAPLLYLLCPKQGLLTNNADLWGEESRDKINERLLRNSYKPVFYPLYSL